jgi:hypothetical protein
MIDDGTSLACMLVVGGASAQKLRATISKGPIPMTKTKTPAPIETTRADCYDGTRSNEQSERFFAPLYSSYRDYRKEGIHHVFLRKLRSVGRNESVDRGARDSLGRTITEAAYTTDTTEATEGPKTYVLSVCTAPIHRRSTQPFVKSCGCASIRLKRLLTTTS